MLKIKDLLILINRNAVEVGFSARLNEIVMKNA